MSTRLPSTRRPTPDEVGRRAFVPRPARPTPAGLGRRAFLAGTTAVVASLAGCLFVGGPAVSSSRSTFDLDELPAGTRLEVDADVGDVTVRTTSARTVSVVVTAEGSAAAVEAVDAAVVHEEPAGVVRVTVRNARPGPDAPTVAVDVAVPAGVVVGRVDTRDGTVTRLDRPSATTRAA